MEGASECRMARRVGHHRCGTGIRVRGVLAMSGLDLPGWAERVDLAGELERFLRVKGVRSRRCGGIPVR
jgi:hypothetical protein